MKPHIVWRRGSWWCGVHYDIARPIWRMQLIGQGATPMQAYRLWLLKWEGLNHAR